MKIRPFLCLCFSGAFFALAATTSVARIWTSSSGSTLEGEFVKSDGKTVTLLRPDGAGEMTFPLIKLSQEDRDFVAALAAGGAAAEAAVASQAIAPLGEGWTEGVFGTYKVNYLLYQGPSLDKTKKYPLVIYLHGKEGVGHDNRSQLKDGVVETFINRSEYSRHPCLVLVPQLRAGRHWASEYGNDVLDVARNLIGEYPVDEYRIYLCGHSLGAVGALHLMNTRMAGVVASAGFHPSTEGAWHMSPRLHQTPLWIFHGENDELLSVDDARLLFQRIKEANRHHGTPVVVKYTEYPGEGSDIALKVFSTPDVHEWLFDQALKSLNR